MEQQKEALNRIVEQLHCKNEEAFAIHSDLLSDLRSLNEAYESSQADLISEFDKLYDVLARKKASMLAEISSDLLAKKDQIESQLKNYGEAHKDAEDLIASSKKALAIDSSPEFNHEVLSIKDRITMSSIFRLTMTTTVADPSCHLVADFTREESFLEKLTFLPVPMTPVIDETMCHVIDNSVSCEWTVPVEEGLENDDLLPSRIESYLFQYRQVRGDQGNQDVPWKSVENLKAQSYTIRDLPFSLPFIQVRVQAWNKAVGGMFSNVTTIATPAFNFSLDPDACHGNLKIIGPHKVEWGAAPVKSVESRLKSSSRPSSPVKSASPKRATPKGRFVGESYTVLGDTPIPDEDIYFEVTPQDGSKTFSIGVTSKSLSRYDQLGRTSQSWCVTVNKWIQNTFVAKHNNKMKNLDPNTVPTKFAVYFSPQLNYLAFYDADRRELLHSFKQVRCNAAMLVGLSAWCGSLEVHTGVQVPSWVESRSSVSPPKTRSMSIVSSETSHTEDP